MSHNIDKAKETLKEATGDAIRGNINTFRAYYHFFVFFFRIFMVVWLGVGLFAVYKAFQGKGTTESKLMVAGIIALITLLGFGFAFLSSLVFKKIMNQKIFKLEEFEENTDNF